MKNKLFTLLACSLLILAAACDVKDPIYDPPTAPDPGIPINPPTDDLPWTDTDALPAGYDLTIANETQLRKFAELVNTGGKLPNGKFAIKAKVLQTADITLTQEEWTPIGNGNSPFVGTYNGDGHTIIGLTITTATPSGTGGTAFASLFGVVGNRVLAVGEQRAVLTGIHLRKVQIDIPAGGGETSLYVGSIAGFINNSILSLCSAEGTVKASSDAENVVAGGIVGENNYSTISRCRASVETTTASTHPYYGYACAGEIVGDNSLEGFVLSCEALGKPVAAEASRRACAGGIAGFNTFSGGTIAFCRTGANAVTAQGGNENYAGGLAGRSQGYIYSCYSRATATATDGTDNRAGGIIGSSLWGVVEHCYGAGANDKGTSDLNATGNIVYETSPDNDAIYDVMRSYPNKVESIPNSTAYPFATRHTPTAFPAHGIEPVRVKWGPGEDAWQRGTNTTYPEINMKYGGEDNPEP